MQYKFCCMRIHKFCLVLRFNYGPFWSRNQWMHPLNYDHTQLELHLGFIGLGNKLTWSEESAALLAAAAAAASSAASLSAFLRRTSAMLLLCTNYETNLNIKFFQITALAQLSCCTNKHLKIKTFVFASTQHTHRHESYNYIQLGLLIYYQNIDISILFYFGDDLFLGDIFFWWYYQYR